VKTYTGDEDEDVESAEMRLQVVNPYDLYNPNALIIHATVYATHPAQIINLKNYLAENDCPVHVRTLQFQTNPLSPAGVIVLNQWFKL
jgi:hypothetical protein